MEENQVQDCRKCTCFVWCESPKITFHAQTGEPCPDYDERE